MKKKIALSSMIAMGSLGLSEGVLADDYDIKFKGKVIEGACSVKPVNEIDFGEIPLAILNSSTGGNATTKLNSRAFSIDLENCQLSTSNNNVSVTFTATGTTGTLVTARRSTDNSAKNIGIGIDSLATESAGAVTFGTALAATALGAGNNSLPFSAYVRRANSTNLDPTATPAPADEDAAAKAIREKANADAKTAADNARASAGDFDATIQFKLTYS